MGLQQKCAFAPAAPKDAADVRAALASVRSNLQRGRGFEAWVRMGAQRVRDPSRSIRETAHAPGFSEAAAFNRTFKRWTGMTPTQYREQRTVKRPGWVTPISRSR